MIVSMKRLTLIGIKEDEAAILKAFQRIGVVELISVTSDEDAGGGDKLDKIAARISRLSESLSAIKPYAPKQGLFTPTRQEKLETLQKDGKAAEEAAAHIEGIRREQKELESRIEKNRALFASLVPWTEFTAPMESVRSDKLIRCFTGVVDSSGEEAIKNNPVLSSEFYGWGASRAALVVAHREDGREASAFLKSINWTDTVFPKMAGTPGDAMEKLSAENTQMQSRLEELLTELSSCGADATVLQNSVDANLIERDRLAAEQQVERNYSIFRLEGWVREDQQKEVEEAVKSVTEAYYAEFNEPAAEEVPPAVLKNNRFNTPFESLIELYSLPDPRGIDATPYMTPFYILLFGVMLSDTGYGLVLSIGAWLLLKLKKPTGGLAGLAKVLFWGGVSTMVWGVLVGAFFGVDFDVIFGTTNVFPLLIDPMSNPIGMLVICLGLGIIHLCSGLAIKMKMCFDKKDWQSAVFDNLSWIFILAGLVLFALPMIGGLFDPALPLDWYTAAHINTVGVYLALLGALLILLFKGRNSKNPIFRIGSGLGGLYSVTSYLSDILSYARLLALGIATGYLAMVFNTLCSMLMNGGSIVMKILGFLIAVVLLVALHLFGIAINTLGSFVHCARLQYVEFFSKFYEAGGKAFRPLGYKTRHVQISK